MHLGLIGPFTRHSCFPSRYLSMRIAASHINHGRDDSFCPAVGKLKNDFYISYELADTNANEIGGVQAALQITQQGNKTGKVRAILGPNSSGSSKAVSTVLSIFNFAQVSWAATNAGLSNKANFPQFFRVVPPDSLTMGTFAGFVERMGYKEVNLVYFDATFQSGQARDFLAVWENKLELPVAGRHGIPNSGSGGAAVSDPNRVAMTDALRLMKSGRCRVVVALAINEEANDLWEAALEMGLVGNAGWIWLGGDGISGGQFAGDKSRVKAFVGTIYILPQSQGPTFPAYKAKWAELMPTTARPEFEEMKLCQGGKVCTSHPEFKGWKDGVHDKELACQGYTAFAYDAMVSMAVAFDRMLSAGKTAEQITPEDWLEELKGFSKPENAIDCLSGMIQLDENQDRPLPMNFFNYQRPDDLNAVKVASWNQRDGVQWELGMVVHWPSGETSEVLDAAEGPVTKPSGAVPVCTGDTVFRFESQRCESCPEGFQVGGGECVRCKAGSFFDVDFRACRECRLGTYAHQEGLVGTCEPCPPGFYQDTLGRQACRPCAPGQWSDWPGAASCVPCAYGWYNDWEGSRSCSRCPTGTYSDQPSSTTCTPCPGAHMTTPFEAASGAHECVCAEGHFHECEGDCTLLSEAKLRVARVKDHHHHAKEEGHTEDDSSADSQHRRLSSGGGGGASSRGGSEEDHDPAWAGFCETCPKAHICKGGYYEKPEVKKKRPERETDARAGGAGAWGEQQKQAAHKSLGNGTAALDRLPSGGGPHVAGGGAAARAVVDHRLHTPPEKEEAHVHEAILFPFVALAVAMVVILLIDTYAPSMPVTVAVFVCGMAFGGGLLQAAHGREGLHHTGGSLGRSLDLWLAIDPHVLLFGFLPGLLFGDSMSLDVGMAKCCFLQALLLAGPGVLMGAAGVGVYAAFVLPYGWSFAELGMFGSILSATDPVAVVSILKSLGASPSLTMQITLESLLNDGVPIENVLQVSATKAVPDKRPEFETEPVRILH